MSEHYHTVKVKICGMRSLQDIQAAFGADALGFLTEAPASPRNLSPKTIKQLISQMPSFMASVLVVPLKDPVRIGWLASEIRPAAVQVHTEVLPLDVKRIRHALPSNVKLCSLIGVIGEADPLIRHAYALAKSGLDGLILDTKKQGQFGGTGEVHDWAISRHIRDAVAPLPVILAGGLNSQNVLDALCAVRPYAVDVSSGVERDNAKSPEKILEFLRKVKSYGHKSC